MTSDEQEALSHQHSHGFWLVPLESGAFAVFDHPNGRLLDTVKPQISFGVGLAMWLRHHSRDAFTRHEARTVIVPRIYEEVNTDGIDL